MSNLLALDFEEFARVVDNDVRGKASAEDHAALRTKEVLPRWRRQLRRMEMNVSGTIEARDADNEIAHIDAILAGDERKAAALRRDHLSWRAGAIRFRTGVREAIFECEDLMDRLS